LQNKTQEINGFQWMDSETINQLQALEQWDRNKTGFP